MGAVDERLEGGLDQKDFDELMVEFTKSRIDNKFTYHPPKPEQIEMYTELREAGKQMALLIDKLCPMSSEREMAMLKIDETIMWANASIARNT
jgi:hypothetical protein